jgi:hypothetical protein
MFNPESPPEWQADGWLGTHEPLGLTQLKGRVIVAVAFQMLCPGCIEHGLPQARKIAQRFAPAEVAVIGMHCVFEHHEVMTRAALEAFQHEYKWPFPIMLDAADGDGIPKTMQAYEMQGTPTLLLFDRAGRLRRHYFGRPDDMLIAAQIMALSVEPSDSPRQAAAGIERLMAKTLREPGHDHAHAHGHDHDHEHEHEHDHHHHAHDHNDGCGCSHEHHDHGAHQHEHRHEPPPAAAQPTKPASRPKASTKAKRS